MGTGRLTVDTKVSRGLEVMKIFISWSDTRSQSLAQALRDWLPLVLHYVEPWLSETDLAAGERWVHGLAKELEASNFGIICVTRENIFSPWILFEAGSLAKSLADGRVIPLLLGVEFSDIIGGPLAQFQAKKVERAGLKEVVQSINRSAAQPVPDNRMNQLFDALWPKLEEEIAKIPEAEVGSRPSRRQEEILEELVTSVRALQADHDLLVEILDFVRRQVKQSNGHFPTIEEELARLRGQLGAVSPKTQEFYREMVTQALGREWPRGERGADVTRTPATQLYIEVQGEHKGLKNGMPIFYDYSGGNFIDEFARRTELDADAFGTRWLFKDEAEGHTLTAEEARDPVSYFRSREPKMVLEIIR
jgi:hypothetical protein